jgi:hypothetical protein
MASKFGFECRHRYRELAVILSMMALLSCAGDVFGQGMDADRAIARARMAEGRARRSANDLQGALESFRAADSLLHFPTTGLEVARAEADLGLLLQASKTLRGFLDIPEPSNDLPQFKKARALAAALLVEIERTIPTMRITVTGAPAGTASRWPSMGSRLRRPRPPSRICERIRPPRRGHTAVTGEAKEEVDLETHESKEIKDLPSAGPPPLPRRALPRCPSRRPRSSPASGQAAQHRHRRRKRIERSYSSDSVLLVEARQ